MSFELSGPAEGYVAFALSWDTKMVSASFSLTQRWENRGPGATCGPVNCLMRPPQPHNYFLESKIKTTVRWIGLEKASDGIGPLASGVESVSSSMQTGRRRRVFVRERWRQRIGERCLCQWTNVPGGPVAGEDTSPLPNLTIISDNLLPVLVPGLTHTHTHDHVPRWF